MVDSTSLLDWDNNPTTTAERFIGRIITAASFADNELRLSFDNGLTVRIYDGGQSCCEHRYMETADNATDLVGQKLSAIDVKKVESGHDDDGYSFHEIAFLEVRAGHVIVAFSTHNEHNGYYGGFDLSLSEVG